MTVTRRADQPPPHPRLAIAETELTVLPQWLPDDVMTQLNGEQPFGTLLSRYRMRREDRRAALALPGFTDDPGVLETGVIGEQIAVRSSALVTLDGTHLPCAAWLARRVQQPSPRNGGPWISLS